MGTLLRSLGTKLSRAFGRGAQQRQLQEQADVHRLFLFAALDDVRRALGNRLFEADTARQQALSSALISRAQALPFAAQRAAVHRNLCAQVAEVGTALHAALGAAGDPRSAAAALEQAAAAAAAAAAAGAAAAASSSPPSQQHKQTATTAAAVMSQAQLREALRRAVGYAVAVRPTSASSSSPSSSSSSASAAAAGAGTGGLGLFVEGAAAPGQLLALFPGLAYARAHYRRLPNYPRIDKDNPFLVSRYDGCVIDSQPWGLGWLADGSGGGGGGGGREAAAAAAAEPPRRAGLLGRAIAAADGPRRPPPPTEWVRATTAEAAELERLEGRHPLALAHYAGHGQPNALLASFTFSLPAAAAALAALEACKAAAAAAGGVDGDAAAVAAAVAEAAEAAAAAASTAAAAVGDGGSGDGSSSGGGSVLGAQQQQQEQQQWPRPWLRAYAPTIPYTTAEPLRPEELLAGDVPMVALVAAAPLRDGDEVRFDHRLSPAAFGGRPAGYRAVNDVEERRRWA